MIFFHGLRLYRLAAAEADMSYTPPFGGAIFFSMVRMIELLQKSWRRQKFGDASSALQALSIRMG